MAVPSTSPSQSTNPQNPNPNLTNHINDSNINQHPSPNLTNHSPNYKACHQCRQKTKDFFASCKNVNVKNGKQCPLTFCKKCLFNRYGEKTEEKALLDDWRCPKCRGKCNCSMCRKRSGQKPTGILSHTAKASGFSSVSEMLDVKGSQCIVDAVCSSLKKVQMEETASKVIKCGTPRKDGKENYSDGVNELKSQVAFSPIVLKTVKPKKRKHTQLKDMEQTVDTCKNSKEKELNNKEDPDPLDPNGVPSKKHKKKNPDVKTKYNKLTTSQESNSSEEKSIKMNGVTKKIAVESENLKAEDTNFNENLVDKEVEVAISLPLGKYITVVGGTELASEDVGQALQFLEFCAAFGKVFDMRKGQAEAIIREIVRARGRRQSQYSTADQFHMQLISLIQESGENCSQLSPTREKDSWLQAAVECISNSKFQKALSNFSTTAEGYNALDTSKRLILLNFLCDEALDTEKIRLWIKEEYSKILEEKKHCRDEVAAANEKLRVEKRKMQDELGKVTIAENGSPATISEHEMVVSQIKGEAAEPDAQILEAKRAFLKNGPRSDAVRTEPLFVDSTGNTFWRLKSCSGEHGIMLQEMKEADGIIQSDSWLSYDEEQMITLENYMYSRKKKMKRVGGC